MGLCEVPATPMTREPAELVNVTLSPKHRT
jgi:hypothetical protein